MSDTTPDEDQLDNLDLFGKTENFIPPLPGESSEESYSRTERGFARIGIILLGFILTPIAAFICGFCCCFAAIPSGQEEGLILGFAIGAILGAIGTIYLIVKWLKRV